MLAITVNGRPVPAAAIVEKGHALLPLRATAQALGATVWYDAAQRRVIVKRFTQRLVLHPRIIANRAYVPLRFLAQALGAVVGYDAARHLVRISDLSLQNAMAPEAPPASDFTTPQPLPPPSTTDSGPSYGTSGFSFYTTGARAFYPGDWMHFVLIAPAGGTASLQLCNLGYRYDLANDGYGNRYEVSVPAPYGIDIPDCLVTAEYTSWSGRTTYVPEPLYIGLYTMNNVPRYAPTPTPSPAWTTAAPPGLRRPEPAPVTVQTPVPRPVRTREPVIVRTPEPRPSPKPTP